MNNNLSTVKIIEKTSNVKLGPISVTYASQASCPNSCPFKGNGCYAESGPVYWSVTSKLNKSPETNVDKIAEEEAKAIDTLSATRHLRIHVVGDSTTDKAAKAISKAATKYKKKAKDNGHDVKVYKYTHCWSDVKRSSFGKDISVLASCETANDIKKARSRGYAAAIVVDTFKDKKVYEIEGGERIIPCPSQTKDGTTCNDCRLCMDDERLLKAKLTIAFESHGARKGTVKKKLISLNTVEEK